MFRVHPSGPAAPGVRWQGAAGRSLACGLQCAEGEHTVPGAALARWRLHADVRQDSDGSNATLDVEQHDSVEVVKQKIQDLRASMCRNVFINKINNNNKTNSNLVSVAGGLGNFHKS
jgi:hypothetical protein